jgi:excisionase family DNA binding protein
MDEQKLTITVEEAAHLLGISRGLAYEMVRIGKIPSVRFGRRLVVPRRALERLLELEDADKLTYSKKCPSDGMLP